ncbi:zinc finger protein 8 [Stomoxys calcitrans]|uniref:zinc finger protein 8 n=1 Tax=Stomoxys calcitrans TaxID=35570 RepID=UPI0027E293A1|nr:zinc finger protein 8 [Stomoxys calcitrans]
MHDLRMGYKQSLLQRLQHLEMSAYQKLQNDTKNVESDNETQAVAAQVTDFSIQRILGETTEKCPPVQSPPTSSSSITQDTPPCSPKLYAPVPTKPAPVTVDILDLSKSKASENFERLNSHTNATTNATSITEYPYNPSTLMPYPAIHPNILAAVAAANAQKFYAQFFPHILPGGLYGQLSMARPTPTVYQQKRYFAPYVLNNSCNNPPNQSVAHPPLTPPTPTQTLNSSLNQPSTPNKYLCPRLDCLDCLDLYHKSPTHSNSGFPYNKTPILSPAASTVSSTSSYHSKVHKDVLLSSSNISLTSVTNIQVSTSKSSRGGMENMTSIFDTRSTISSNPEEISYKCRICDKVFGCSQTLQAHEKTHKSPRYECTDCGKGFSQLRNYKYHLSVHRGTKEFAAECPECGKTFNDKGYLSSHMKIHRNKKEYECPYCPKSFNQRVAFNMHVRIHTGVKPHKCSECGKRFSRKMLLKQHMRTHSGEKPYQCSVCGKSFADRSNMTLHHRLHSGIKPFNCPICPKAFTKKHHLKTHLNYHTGCKPYVCPHPNCNQAFTQSSNMRTHAKKCQYRPLQFPSATSPTVATATPPASQSSVRALTAASVTNSNQSRLLNSISRLPTSTTSGSGNGHGNGNNLFHNGNGNIPFMPATTLAAGIRMLSTVTPTVPSQSAAFPPAQQPLLSTLRPF